MCNKSLLFLLEFVNRSKTNFIDKQLYVIIESEIAMPSSRSFLRS